MGSIPITRSIFILAHKNSVNQWFWVWELINLTTKTYNISIVVHGSQIRDELVPLAYFYLGLESYLWPCVVRFFRLVFWEDGRSGEAVFVGGAGVVQVFITRHLEDGPAVWVDAHDSSGPKTFGNEIGFQADLDSTATKGDVSFRLCEVG